MKGRSIRFRLTALYTAILAATLLAAGIAAVLAIRRSVEETVDKDLRLRAGALREYLEKETREEGLAGLAGELEEQASTGPAGVYLRIADAGGRWIYRSSGTQAWDPAAPAAKALGAKGTATTTRIRGKPLRILSVPVPAGVAQIGLPLDEFEEMQGKFALDLALASPLLLLAGGAGGFWLSGRALRPVDRIAATARRIGARNLSERLALRETGDELDRLSSTLNDMLFRLEAAFGKVTRFTADASHELRTPLAIMRTTAEVIRSKPRTGEEHSRAWDRIIAQTERTSALIEGLLLLARADAGNDGFTFARMDLAGIVRDACEEMQVLAEASGLRLESAGLPECRITGDAAAIRRLLLILLDNAVKYTQAGGEIRVSLQVDGETAVIRVRDTGCGISADEIPHIFDRFYRTARDRSRATGGAGLGLAIGQWIATRHGGGIEVASTPSEGSVFSVRLRLAL